LNRTPASAGNQQKWTWSGWVKRGQLGAQQKIFFAGASGTNFASFEFISDDNFQLFSYVGTTDAYLISSQVFRDTSAWYHIIVSADSTQATASNRIKVYVNGTQVTSFSTATYPSQNYNFPFNSTVAHTVGRDNPNANNYFDGYLVETNFIDGQALTPSSFGENNEDTGVWQPKKYAGTYGTNGFYLPFTDNSALTTSSNVGLGKDFSGNGNFFATNNISITAGSNYDSMTDVPTLTSATAANYCVMNPLDTNSPILPQNGNLQLTNSNQTHNVTRGTIALSSGKFYWEINVNSIVNFYSGIYKTNTPLTLTVGANSNSYAYVGISGDKRFNETSTSYGSALSGGDVLGCALDLDSGKIWWSKNGTFIASGNPVAGTNEAFSGISGEFTVAAGCYDSTINMNFGQRPFAYTPPTGFVALNTFNLPTPTIGATETTQANKYFDVSLWTGNGTDRSIVNSGSMQPDLLWQKRRSGEQNNWLTDSVRGNTKILASNQSQTEGTVTDCITSFNSNGFSLGVNDAFNGSGTTNVMWQWNAGGSTVTNTSGSISSQVRANPSSGFSVVTYTGNGSAGATIGHGLGVAPSIIFVKNRSVEANWAVYTKTLGGTKFLLLNTTAAESTSSINWNDTNPTSSVFSIGTSNRVNASGATYVAYCFSEITGYSKFGSYTGNGSTDGAFVYLGFKPAFIMTKKTNSTSNWIMQDDARSPFNTTNATLFANLGFAEETGYNIDLLSNGFKAREFGTDLNGSGQTYIYMAFAETPFNYSLAR
jgi:hypothetical protein